MKGLEVKNEIFGTINFNTIYKKIIEHNCFEKIMEKCIQAFLYNEKYNVLICQILRNNCEHLNHIQFLYENYLKNEENNMESTNKTIIFIIYLKRNILNIYQMKIQLKILILYHTIKSQEFMI